MDNTSILSRLTDAVVAGDTENVERTVNEALSAGVDPVEVLRNGLEPGLLILGEKWKNGDVFLPQILMGSESMKTGIALLRPKIGKERSDEVKPLGTVVIGTAYGDMHNIGKNIVTMMLEVAGFNVFNLGESVPPMKFIEKAEELDADIIAISCLLSPSMYYQKDVVSYLNDMGVRDKYWVLIGGGPVTPEWVKEIGADGYAKNAFLAAEVAKSLAKSGGEMNLPIIKV
jgi:5-methyltetrahydrofolate--homocysteine methyltransferase